MYRIQDVIVNIIAYGTHKTVTFKDLCFETDQESCINSAMQYFQVSKCVKLLYISDTGKKRFLLLIRVVLLLERVQHQVT